MTTYSFDIETTTHDLLKEGIVAGRFFGAQQNWQRVVVEADSIQEGSLIAILIGGCFGYVTNCHYRE